MADPTRTVPPPDAPAVTQSLADGTATGGDAPTSSAVILPTNTGRYQLGAEIARGGMGAVYRATDTTLGREVAIKVLGDKYAPGSATARRFFDEARITGQLQHPGIPPVHDLGTLPDGRPFLAMKLIKGQTLDELLTPRPDPAADRGRFVAVFEQVCHAVAYAHAHHVLHRDLKPANVMVGAFGEVQVMDWGLAKVLAPGTRNASDGVDPDATADPDPTEIKSLRDAETQAGSVLGTPAFMPPEQAVGAIAKIDARSDVFGLGAILVVILTGKPPFTAASAETVRVKAAQGDVAECFERLDACEAEPELVALCKRCLAPKPEGRPADADEVARAVHDMRAAADERAQQAELDRVTAEGEKTAADLRAAEYRMRSRLRLTLTASVGLLVAGGGAIAWWQQWLADQRANERAIRTAESRQAAELALDQAEAAVARENPNYGEIEAALAQAEQRLATGDIEDSRWRFAALTRDRAMLKRLDGIDNRRWAAEEYLARTADVVEMGDAFHAAFREYGLDVRGMPIDHLSEMIRGSRIVGRLTAAIDEWLAVELDPKLAAVMAGLDSDPDRTAVRHAIGHKDYIEIARRTARLDGRTLPPSFAVLVGRTASAPGQGVRILREALSARPDHFGLVMSLANVLGREAQAEKLMFYRIAIALRPSNPIPHANLAIWMLTTWTHDLAGGAWETEQLKQLGKATDGRILDEAIEELRVAIRLDARSQEAHTWLARVLFAKFAEAAVGVAENDIRLAPNDAGAHFRLGHIYWSTKDPQRAIPFFEKAAELDPTATWAYFSLGMIYHYINRDLSRACQAYRSSIRHGVLSLHSYREMALALKNGNDLTGAVAAWREVVRRNPHLSGWQVGLGDALTLAGDRAAAIEAYTLAVRLDPANQGFHYHLERSLRDRGDFAAAIAVCRQVIQIDPTHAIVHNDLGLALRELGDLDGSLESIRKAVRLDPKAGYSRTALGDTLVLKGEMDEAVTAFRDALRISPNDGYARRRVRQAERMRELLPRLPDILTGRTTPTSPAESCEFAELCVMPFQRQYSAAVRLFEQGFAADPKLADHPTASHRYNAACAAVRSALGHGADAPADPTTRTALRRKALDWLQADLVQRRKQATSFLAAERSQAAARLQYSLVDTDLAGTRPGLLRIVMPCGERAEWDRLWADVKAALAQAQKPLPREVLPPPRRE